ncbi:MAG: hypothetical protein R3335_05800 [Anaerolineales bacterium]|nr:hypothetical protein [Anaerolineales bacterium]
MSNFLAIPILGLAVILQTTILSRVTLLQGPADIVLLTLVSWIFLDRGHSIWLWPLTAGLLVGVFSALPFWLPVLTYTGVTGIALAMKRRVWQVPILALFTSVFFGTILTTSVAFFYLSVQGIPLNGVEAVNIILLPSIILNLILAIPVQAVLKEINRWVDPAEVEVEV